MLESAIAMLQAKRLILWLLVAAVYPLVRWRSRSGRSPGPPRSILLIDNAKIGDLVCITPVFRALQESFPDCQLTLLTDPSNQGVVIGNPRLTAFIWLKRRASVHEKWLVWKQIYRGYFDIAVVLAPGTASYLLPYLALIPRRVGTTAPEHGSWYERLARLTMTDLVRFPPRYLSVRHYLDLLEPLGVRHYNLAKEIFPLAEAETEVSHFLLSESVKPDETLVVIAPTSGNKIKEWPLERFAVVATGIYQRYGWRPVLIGSKRDAPTLERLVALLPPQSRPLVVHHLKLASLPSLLKRARFFISVDSGPLYIANALGVPVLDIAGPCDIYDQMPIYEACEVVYVRDLPGWPYSSVLSTATSLTTDQARAVSDISPEMVLEAFDRLVSKYGQT